MGKKDAIPQDVSEAEPEEVEQVEVPEEETPEPETPPEEEQPVDPNQALRDSIFAARAEEIAKETGVPVEEHEPTEEPEEGDSPEDEPEPEVDPEEEEGEPPEEAPAETEKERLVIDGEETDVEVSKILDAGRRAMQKDLAADKRLEEATRLQKEAMDTLQQAKEQATKKEEPEKKQEDPPVEDVSREELVAALESIQMGDTEEGASVLEKYIKGRRSAPATPQPDVREVVKEELRQQEQMTIRERLFQSQEKGGFADLIPEKSTLQRFGIQGDGGTGNHATFAAFQAEASYLIEVEGKPDVWSTYEQAGLTTRERFFPAHPKEEEQAEENPTRKKEEARAKKVERKRNLTSVKSATESIETPEVEQDDKPSDVIIQMRKDRGLE